MPSAAPCRANGMSWASLGGRAVANGSATPLRGGRNKPPSHEATPRPLLLDRRAALSPMAPTACCTAPYGRTHATRGHATRAVFFSLSAIHQKRSLLRAVWKADLSLRDCLGVLKWMLPSAAWLRRQFERFGVRCLRTFCLPRHDHRLPRGPRLGVALPGVGAFFYNSVPGPDDEVIGLPKPVIQWRRYRAISVLRNLPTTVSGSEGQLFTTEKNI